MWICRIILIFLFNKVNKDKIIKIRDLTLLATLVSISSFSIVTSMKYIWGRPRYWALNGDYSQFCNYLTISGTVNSLMGNAYMSFPSGHTNAATCLIILPFAFDRLIKSKPLRYLMSSLCYIYVFMVALSRICVGAHFASDVLFGFGINCLCFTVIYVYLKKKGWLHVGGNKC